MPISSEFDPRHCGDRWRVGYRLWCFEHHNNEGRGVYRGAGSAGGDRNIAEMRQPARYRAVAVRRIAQSVGNLTRLLGSVDMRHDDPEGAAVEHPGGEPELPGRNPHDRRDPGAERGDRDLHRGVEVHRIVLEVEKQPVIAAGSHDRGDVDGAALADADAECQFAGLESLASGVAKGRFHNMPPFDHTVSMALRMSKAIG